MSRNAKEVWLALFAVAFLVVVVVVLGFEIYVLWKLFSFASDAGWTSHDGIIYTTLGLLLLSGVGNGISRNRKD